MTSSSIEINGVYDVYLTIGNVFDEMLGVTAIDSIDGDITKDVEVIGKVDTNKVGKYPLTYKITNSIGETISAKRYVYVKTFIAKTYTMPQDFSPICVRCDDNGILRQVGDIKNNDESIRISESFIISEKCLRIFLKYNDVTDLILKLNNEIFKDFIIEDNEIIFNETIENCTIDVSYKLRNSFTVHYNDKGLDISLHTDIPSNYVEINYESNENSNTRGIKHLSFNPIYNSQYGGFLYIDNKKYKENILNIHCSVKYMFSNLQDKTRIYVELLDINNNPIFDEEILIKCSAGKIEQDYTNTDVNGIVPLTYYAPNENGNIEITAEYKDLKSTVNILIKERSL